ncbi:hypothetical protein GOP47_0015763 [Adiantum capillus-veneris]|uniref:Uncharacterized protein n=1 Tax=Adiantum capillus-veneris TaxID=13818 RepID=A0A9D4UL27_ADICA|nr:hypothetical protein GOP47_0015763 [Adiantum capillus-veneris]
MLLAQLVGGAVQGPWLDSAALLPKLEGTDLRATSYGHTKGEHPVITTDVVLAWSNNDPWGYLHRKHLIY